MHDGVIPGAFSANVITRIPNEESPNSDMKKQNQRKAPKKRGPRKSFGDWLRLRAQAEEEEYLDDEELEDEELDDEEFDEYPDSEEDDDLRDDEDDPEEFDDYEREKELDFDDDEERAPFPLPKSRSHDEEDGVSGLTGRFSDFYRMSGEEEQEDAPGGFEPGQAAVGTASAMGQKVSKKDKARAIMRQLASKPGITRDEMIQELIRQLPTTDSTATSYYEDIAREMGLMGNKGGEDMAQEPGMGDEGPVDSLPGDTEQQLSQEEIDAQDPNAQGIIRTVDKAHLVFKRQMEDGKFEELWVYNLGDKIHDSLNVRREILGGTDIPRGHTRSEDGHQTYTLHTLGNAQLLHVTGLAN